MIPTRADEGKFHGSRPGWGLLSVAEIAEAKTLWETTELTASEIAAHFTTDERTVTRNAVVSHAHRHKWAERAPARVVTRTLFDRLAELHEAYNAKVGKPPGSGYVRGPGAPLR